MEQELLILGDVEITLEEEMQGTVVVRLSGQLFLGTVERSDEGFWRFIPGYSSYDSTALQKIAKKLQELDDEDLGLVGKIHQ